MRFIITPILVIVKVIVFVFIKITICINWAVSVFFWHGIDLISQIILRNIMSDIYLDALHNYLITEVENMKKS